MANQPTSRKRYASPYLLNEQEEDNTLTLKPQTMNISNQWKWQLSIDWPLVSEVTFLMVSHMCMIIEKNEY